MTNEREPMIKLESGGSAPILSYNVPEPTSYSGRNFIDLQLPESYFIKPAVNANRLLAEQPALTATSDDTEVTVESVQEFLTQQLAATAEPISPELANLDPNQVVIMAQAGKKLNIYRSLYGTLTYNYIDAYPAEEPTLAAGQVYQLRPREDWDPEPEPDPVTVYVNITAPGDGATLNGPHTGVTITVSGTASITGGRGSRRITKVQVAVGSSGFEDATSQSGISWSQWTYSKTITTSGRIAITAKASGSGASDQQTIYVNVALAEPPDTTPPAITITSPTNGTVLSTSSAGEAIAVMVRGTAADARGIQSVDVKVNEGNFEQATAGDASWSTWTKQFSLTPGAYTITARSLDRAGNASTSAVSLTVKAAPPPDKTGPSVTITSPAANAPISGPFSGATVMVTGTSGDPSGVREVALSLNNSPIFVSAQPKAPGDWSTWTGSLTITDTGSQLITAKAIDHAGNESTTFVRVNVTLIPDVVSRVTRLILVESYRLSSYLGSYGAGRTIKTFSLLPGEKTRISIKTYTRREEDAKQASSILDSFTQESANDFEKSMEKEQSNQKGYKESSEYKVTAAAEASWGWGSASVSGEVSGGSNATREEFAKNISNATQKHVAKASAKRDVQVNTSYEVKTQTGEETSIEREIENINVSRTLNFVFRQMNQEFITMLHLVDVRIGYFTIRTVNGVEEKVYREVTLPQLDSLLKEVIVPEKRAEVRRDIIHQLANIFDYQDKHHCFVEEKQFQDAQGNLIPFSAYLRVKKDYTSTYYDATSGTQIRVPGVIMAANKYVLRTEGIIVDALLGQGDGLDDYSHGLQDQAVEAKALSNELTRMEIEKQRLAMQIIETKDTEASKLYDQLYRPAPATPQPKSQESSNGQVSHV